MKKILFILLAVCLYSCGSSTSIEGSWKNQEKLQNANYKKVFIVAMTQNMAARTLVEDELAFHARKQGVEVVKSHELFPGTFTQGNIPSKESLLGLIRDSGCDAIFTVSVLDKETESRYVPGNTTYSYPGYYPMRYGHYGNFYGYYSTMYPITTDPGYYTTDKIYYLESNLYDAATEEILWSAQSKTYNPDNIEDFVQSYTEALIKKLEKENMIKPEK